MFTCMRVLCNLSFFFGCVFADMQGPSSRLQRLNLHPLQWERRVLTADHRGSPCNRLSSVANVMACTGFQQLPWHLSGKVVAETVGICSFHSLEA